MNVRAWPTRILLTLTAILGLAEAGRARIGHDSQLDPRFGLRPDCTLSFKDIAPAQDRFAFCDNSGRIRGQTVPPLSERLRTDAKNNFCAADADVAMQVSTFGLLPDLPPANFQRSRSALTELFSYRGRVMGEGSAVQVIARVNRAYLSSCTQENEPGRFGEAANCYLIARAASEIELRLTAVDSESTRELSAKIVPHFRPEAWSQIDRLTPIPPVKIRGQLFYDDEKAERIRTGRSRMVDLNSLGGWEIHPVYGIDVCTSDRVEDCTAQNTRVWTPYHKWLPLNSQQARDTGAAERKLCEDNRKRLLSR